MKPLAPFGIKNRNLILGFVVGTSMLLALIALIVSGPSNKANFKLPQRQEKLEPSLAKNQHSLHHLPAAEALTETSSNANAFSPPADGRSWNEDSANLLNERLAILSVGPLEHMLAFVQSLPEGDFKTTAWLQTLQTIAAASQETTLLENALGKTPQHLREQAWGAVAEGRASNDPAAGMRWIATIPDPQARESCAHRVAARWGAIEPAAAMAWLEQQPADEHWEPLLHSIVTSWASARPEEAMEWAIRQSQYDADTDHPSLAQLVALVLQQKD
jgi:hypothetical protein